MDMTASIAPKSDQLNADDLITGPVTVTISKVSAGSSEQPVDVHLVEFAGRAFRPSKSMRRVMVAAWGADTSAYTGRTMVLYRDPAIRFGKDEVGGIRISHLSHIDKNLKLALTVSRGKREAFIVEPFVGIVRDAMSGDQMKTIGALFGKLGIKESAAQLAYVSGAVKRDVKSANDLTSSEASAVIDSLQSDETADSRVEVAE